MFWLILGPHYNHVRMAEHFKWYNCCKAFVINNFQRQVVRRLYRMFKRHVKNIWYRSIFTHFIMISVQYRSAHNNNSSKSIYFFIALLCLLYTLITLQDSCLTFFFWQDSQAQCSILINRISASPHFPPPPNVFILHLCYHWWGF